MSVTLSAEKTSTNYIWYQSIDKKAREYVNFMTRYSDEKTHSVRDFKTYVESFLVNERIIAKVFHKMRPGHLNDILRNNFGPLYEGKADISAVIDKVLANYMERQNHDDDD